MEPTSEAPKFVKPEELERPFDGLSTGPSSPSASHFSLDFPKQSESKPVKKRKSWGQELPEPTTNLPPRKRAKTEAEREQRRIERVKRNRQAAHNSRERKRQEHDQILDEKNDLAKEVYRLRAQLSEANTQIARLTGCAVVPLPPTKAQVVSDRSSTSPQATSSTESTPVLSNFTSPPSDFAPYTPDLADNKDIESTQQSAVLLCDLPCRSIPCCQPEPRELLITTQLIWAAILPSIWNQWTLYSTPTRTLPSLTIIASQ